MAPRTSKIRTATKFVVMAVGGLMIGTFGMTALHAQDAAPLAKPPAYFIAEYEITDREGMKPYREQVEATFKAFGGHFVVRGGGVTSLEGDPVKGGLVVIAFDNIDKAKGWYESAAYRAIRPFRQRSARTRAYIVEGTPQ